MENPSSVLQYDFSWLKLGCQMLITTEWITRTDMACTVVFFPGESVHVISDLSLFDYEVDSFTSMRSWLFEWV